MEKSWENGLSNQRELSDFTVICQVMYARSKLTTLCYVSLSHIMCLLTINVCFGLLFLNFSICKFSMNKSLYNYQISIISINFLHWNVNSYFTSKPEFVRWHLLAQNVYHTQYASFTLITSNACWQQVCHAF